MPNRTQGKWDVNTLAGRPFREVFCGDVHIADTGYCSTLEEIEGNAEFIVLACNSHDDLVNALKKLANEADSFLSLSDPETHGYTNTAILRQRIGVARAIIAKIESQSTPEVKPMGDG